MQIKPFKSLVPIKVKNPGTGTYVANIEGSITKVVRNEVTVQGPHGQKFLISLSDAENKNLYSLNRS